MDPGLFSNKCTKFMGVVNYIVVFIVLVFVCFVAVCGSISIYHPWFILIVRPPSISLGVFGRSIIFRPLFCFSGYYIMESLSLHLQMSICHDAIAFPFCNVPELAIMDVQGNPLLSVRKLLGGGPSSQPRRT